MSSEVLTPELETIEEVDESRGSGIAGLARVILFNDEVHSFDDVIIQLIKAISCTPDRAEEYAWEVHNIGKASVFEGELHECLKVSSILEEIDLHTQIEM